MEVIVVRILVLVFSIVVHEVAHGLAAYRLGDDTAKRAGRLTLNPISHIDPMGSIIVPLMLSLSGSGIMFGWAKPVPVRPGLLHDPRNDHAKVAAAGPLSNLMLALLFAVLLGLTVAFGGFPSAPGGGGEGGATPHMFFFTMFQTGVMINVLLAVFNLIPLPPLDGSWILSRFLPPEARANYENLRRYGMMVFLGFILLINFTPLGGIFRRVLFGAMDPFFQLATRIAELGGA